MRRAIWLLYSLFVIAFVREIGAAEFYSWTDSSGTVVITDDPKQVPPEQRQNVMTHHFPAQSAPPAGDVNQADQSNDREARSSSSGPNMRNLQEDDTLPDILLGQPDQTMQPSYVWIPLATPYVWGSQTFTGFWSHRRVALPEKAFRAYLRRQRTPHQIDQKQSNSSQPSLVPRSQSNGAFRDSVYEQVRREREAIQQRGGLLYGSDAAPHSPSGVSSSNSPASNGSGSAPARR